jgi:hypothetical protein
VGLCSSIIFNSITIWMSQDEKYADKEESGGSRNFIHREHIFFNEYKK